jgi:hypothetical protein
MVVMVAYDHNPSYWSGEWKQENCMFEASRPSKVSKACQKQINTQTKNKTKGLGE